MVPDNNLGCKTLDCYIERLLGIRDEVGPLIGFNFRKKF
jgi:hypothetical protein